MEDYNKQAIDFLTTTNTTFEAEFLRFGKHFDSDTEERDIYKITLKRGSREFTFNFGQSINCSQEWHANTLYAKKISEGKRLMGKNRHIMCQPLSISSYMLIPKDFVKNENFEIPTAYGVLACLTKYDPYSLEDFCSEFGYDLDSKSAEKTYNSVVGEYKNVAMLWNEEEIETLQEIQ